MKLAADKKICLLGNLNGIEMANWTKEKAEQEVKRVLFQAGSGGGLLLSDNQLAKFHGQFLKKYYLPLLML